jgi:Asparagine synthase
VPAVPDAAKASASTCVPRACGALGRYSPATLAELASQLGAGLREVHRDARSALWLDREPLVWNGPGCRGIGWSELLPERAHEASSWHEAAKAGGLGLVVEGDHRLVHASASGIGPLYWISAPDAVYFATGVEALARAIPGSRSPDWQSWASIVALGFPCEEDTPFAEIKRLDPLGVIEAVAGHGPRTSSGELTWAEIEPDDAPGLAEEVIERVGDELAGLDGARPLICPLTGGFDSRLIASLLVARGRRFATYTVNNDTGNEREEEQAAAVASELAVPHSIIDWPISTFVDNLLRGAELVEYQSVLRPHLTRLGTGLPGPDATVVDGLDIFIKNRFATPAVLDAPTTKDAAAAMFAELAPERQRFEIFEPGAWDALREAGRAGFLSGAERFDGHPNAPTLIPYWQRMRRGISLSPMVLVGHRHAVAMPLLSDQVVRTALRASHRAKLGRRFYRQVLDVANPAVARLPSTNDDLPRPDRTRQRLDRSRRARRLYLELLAESPLRPWFSAEFESAIERSKLGPALRTGWGVGRVHTLCYLTLWARRHRELLTGFDPAPLFA